MPALLQTRFTACIYNHTLHCTIKNTPPAGVFLVYLIHSKKITSKGENTIEKFLTSMFLRSRTLVKRNRPILPVWKPSNRTILLF